jgi:hypothetical protein
MKGQPVGILDDRWSSNNNAFVCEFEWRCRANHYCTNLDYEEPCPPGRFSNEGSQGDCTQCEAGQYGTVSGLGCNGGMCPPGQYAPAGSTRCYPCRAGRFGGLSGAVNADCQGACTAGYYCPEGSTNPTVVNCGRVDLFCLSGAPSPALVATGFFTIPEGASSANRQGQTVCPPGSFCVSGVKYPCPAGRFRSTPGAAAGECSGVCTAGYYCPGGSTVGTTVGTNPSPTVNCGNRTYYCPAGITAPLVTPAGYFTTPETISSVNGVSYTVCPAGAYCTGGVQYPCPGGAWVQG